MAKVSYADVEFYGDKIILPVDPKGKQMTYDKAISILQERMGYEEQVIMRSRTFDVFPWDGAVALDKALKQKFGWSSAQEMMSFFGSKPPSVIDVTVGPNGEQVSVPWGQFALPTTDGGTVDCGTTIERDRYCFQLTFKLKRKDESVIEDLSSRIKAVLLKESIYKGKTVRIDFLDDDGDRTTDPNVTFLDVSNMTKDKLIFSREMFTEINVKLFTPLERVAELERLRIPYKRTVFLEGYYGTGKTMCLNVAAKLANDNNMTAIYVPSAKQIVHAISFARSEYYQNPNGCLILCEDVDQVFTGQRDEECNQLLNCVDGIESKNSKIFLVVTSNNSSKIQEAMRRPGRINGYVIVEPPDAEAAERLVRLIAGDLLSDLEDLTEVGKRLAGNIPATISDVVNLAKTCQLANTPVGEDVKYITSKSILEALDASRNQLKWLKGSQPEPEVVPDFAKLVGHGVRYALSNGCGEELAKIFQDAM